MKDVQQLTWGVEATATASNTSTRGVSRVLWSHNKQVSVSQQVPIRQRSRYGVGVGMGDAVLQQQPPTGDAQQDLGAHVCHVSTSTCPACSQAGARCLLFPALGWTGDWYMFVTTLCVTQLTVPPVPPAPAMQEHTQEGMLCFVQSKASRLNTHNPCEYALST
jgi:hypothetical protein